MSFKIRSNLSKKMRLVIIYSPDSQELEEVTQAIKDTLKQKGKIE